MNPTLSALGVVALTCAALAACSRKGDKAVTSDTTMAPPAVAAMPSPGAAIDCAAASSDIEKLVCGDLQLTALDQKLSTVYREAEARQVSPAPASFTAEQRNWITRRDDCGKSANPRACVDSAYTLRIAEIQAMNLLVQTRGPITYSCPNPDGSHDEVTAMFAETSPPSVVLERGDRSIVAYRVRSASGAKYEGANVAFWEKGGTAQVTWLGTALKCHEQAGSS